MLCYVMCDLMCWLPAMENKDSSYLKTLSFRSSSPHFGLSKTQTMTEGTSQRDQAGGLVREFKRGEILVKLFSHLVTSTSSPWRRLEIAGSLQDWLEVRKDFFPDPRIHFLPPPPLASPLKLEAVFLLMV
ncbi:hypothetical protein CHARACLAT_006751 [Characodon lateralis]|uniref:Uncharacterized protein n=1 Tax=Characodon lateralis TaxID=208331 RepID=A0ABU7E000_9TELE|nr:hypothetical protein [Characodon lateralis]